MMILGHGLFFQPVFLACTYNGTIIALQKKSDITDFPPKFTHKKVNSASKDSWHGIKIQHAKRNKMTKYRLKWKA